MGSSEDVYIYAHNKPWGLGSFNSHVSKMKGCWYFVSNTEELNEIININPKIIFFVHWGDIVEKSITEKLTCICFHMTDLPFGRGGSPLQNLLLLGLNNTKITAFRMNELLDAGDMYWKGDISLEGSAQNIYERVTDYSWNGIRFIIESNPTPEVQKGKVVIFNRRKPEESKIPKGLSDVELYNFIRMLDADGYPNAFTDHDDIRIYYKNASINNKQVFADACLVVNDEKN